MQLSKQPLQDLEACILFACEIVALYCGVGDHVFESFEVIPTIVSTSRVFVSAEGTWRQDKADSKIDFVLHVESNEMFLLAQWLIQVLQMQYLVTRACLIVHHRNGCFGLCLSRFVAVPSSSSP